jgi:hypothetical protein
MYRARKDPEGLSRLHGKLLHAFRGRTGPEAHLPGEEEQGLVFVLVELEREALPCSDVEKFADVLGRVSPDELEAPGLVDALRDLLQ